MNRLLVSLIVVMIYSVPINAAESIKVVGMFPGKVVVQIDGEHKILKQGVLTDGVRFVKVAGENIVLEVNGMQKAFRLGSDITTNFAAPKVIRKSIRANHRGMFHTTGSINGHVINFLVDTGATTVAMSSLQAKKLNIRYRLEGTETVASTASGRAKAYRVNLKTVKVGAITQRNVVGLVIDGAYPREVLLGMSFLNRLKVEKTGELMILEAR